MRSRARRSGADPAVSELETTWSEVSRVANRRQCQEHVLVLQAVGIPCGSMHVRKPEEDAAPLGRMESARPRDGRRLDEWVVLARPQDAARARIELDRYERENVGWPPREIAGAPVSQGLYAALAYATLLALVFVWQRNEQFGLEWLREGRASAQLIRAGEWWRALTALTLHADLQHILGNVVFGSVFGVILAQSIGVGPAWLTIVASGALGNLANAWIQDPSHASIGASTAVFGALGAQVAIEWSRRGERRVARWKRWAPLVGGLALLGWLGAGGSLREMASARENLRQWDQTLETVDVMAHMTGFASGALIGLALARRPARARSIGWHAGAATLAVALVAIAWVIAFRAA